MMAKGIGLDRIDEKSIIQDLIKKIDWICSIKESIHWFLYETPIKVL